MEQKQSTKTDKITTVLLLLFLAGYVAWCAWYGASGLLFSQKHPMEEVFAYPVCGDRYEGEIAYVSDVRISKQRNINHRWAGTEYFYVVLSEDRSRAIFVRATKHWGDELGNDAYHKASKQAGGIVKNFRYRTKENLAGTVQKMADAGIRAEQNVYLDLLGIPVRIAVLYEGGAVLVFILYIRCLLKKARDSKAKPMPAPVHGVMLLLLVLWIAAFLFTRNAI